MRAAGILALAAVLVAAPAAAAKPKPAHSTAKAKTVAPKPATNDAKNDDGVPLSEETEHVVKEGETLMGVSHRAKVPRVIIIEANGLKKPYEVHAGQHLLLPRTRHHTVKKGESGFDVALKYGVPWSAIAIANGLETGDKVKVGQKLLIPSVLSTSKLATSTDKPTDKATGKATGKPSDAPAKDDAKDEKLDDAPKAGPTPHFLWPLKGHVRRGFTPRASGDYHDGIDITAAKGTAVRAAAAGEVIFAGREPENYGRLVVVDHGDGWQSAYAFLDKITVKQGDSVKAKERVGLVGHTGKAKGDELHFELRRANHQVDPARYLPKTGGDSRPEAKPKKAKAKKPVRD